MSQGDRPIGHTQSCYHRSIINAQTGCPQRSSPFHEIICPIHPFTPIHHYPLSRFLSRPSDQDVLFFTGPSVQTCVCNERKREGGGVMEVMIFCVLKTSLFGKAKHLGWFLRCQCFRSPPSSRPGMTQLHVWLDIVFRCERFDLLANVTPRHDVLGDLYKLCRLFILFFF